MLCQVGNCDKVAQKSKGTKPKETITMKETGIIFSTPMVQAYQQGRKTQTRRLKGLKKINEDPDIWAPPIFDPSTGEWVFTAEHGPGQQVRLKCPFGNKGDRLWVRETWRGIEQEYGPDRIEYKASEKLNLTDPWKPSIHLPKVASRFRPEIISTRPERLLDISETDAIAEGIEQAESSIFDEVWRNYGPAEEDYPYFLSPINSFLSLWESIHGPGSRAWSPWVWRIEFSPFVPFRK
jgi:hypothetical protein